MHHLRNILPSSCRRFYLPYYYDVRYDIFFACLFKVLSAGTESSIFSVPTAVWSPLTHGDLITVMGRQVGPATRRGFTRDCLLPAVSPGQITDISHLDDLSTCSLVGLPPCFPFILSSPRSSERHAVKVSSLDVVRIPSKDLQRLPVVFRIKPSSSPQPPRLLVVSGLLTSSHRLPLSSLPVTFQPQQWFQLLEKAKYALPWCFAPRIYY